jgi:V8-like Glu-specific endopeptidase
MKIKSLFMTLAVGMLLVSSLFASEDKVIYGVDDRLDLYETGDQLYKDLAKSTAAMMSMSNLTDNEDGTYSIKGSSLESRGICKSSKFSQQITAARCSGFLVGKDLFVTAGHCVRTAGDCVNFAWVFDFAVDEADKINFTVAKSSVYKCKEIIEQKLDRLTNDDYALIRLDREVTERTPLNFRREGRVEDKKEILVIGHPTGLPSKIAAGAYVRNNVNDVYFQANLDTFGGNSGSAVFDAENGQVEGILVRGETDYIYDRTRGCRVPKVCTNEGCRGEDVTRITNIEKLKELAN